MDALETRQREEFVRQQRDLCSRQTTALLFSAPLLFLIDWLYDLATLGDAAWLTLGYRVPMAALMLLFAVLARRRIRDGRHVNMLAVAALGLIGLGLAASVAVLPDRLGLAHVVYMLMLVIALPLGVLRSHVAGIIVAVALPALMLLAWMRAPAPVWAAYLAFLGVGTLAGLFQRRRRIGTALQLFQLRQQLLHRVGADTLTGALNREGWFTQAGAAFAEARAAGLTQSIAYLDLDHFKSVNDRHGHGAGDHALENVAAVLRANLREHDLLARLGGEEFVVLLARADATLALQMMERVRQQVEALPGPVPVTLSAGVYQVRAGDVLESAMRLADEALLRAKREGRNRVLLAS